MAGLFGEFFDRVAQHGAGHLGGVLVEESQQWLCIAFADLAEHPAAGFVHEIVRVRQKEGAESERVGEVTGTHEGLSGEDGDALLPEAGGGGEGVEHGAVAPEQPCTEDMRGTAIDEVPVVDPFRVGEVEADEALLSGGVLLGPTESTPKHEQGEQPLFMPFGVQQVQNVILTECISVGSSARICGTLSPRKRSPSPYDPGPVLKNRRAMAACAGVAAFRSF